LDPTKQNLQTNKQNLSQSNKKLHSQLHPYPYRLQVGETEGISTKRDTGERDEKERDRERSLPDSAIPSFSKRLTAGYDFFKDKTGRRLEDEYILCSLYPPRACIRESFYLESSSPFIWTKDK
jgi:hypothetical protein